MEVARSQLQVMVRQGSVNIRPLFKFRIAEHGFVNTPVIIKNVGSGPAFDTRWTFVRPPNAASADQVYPMGTLGVGQEEEMPWPFDKDYPKLQARMVDDQYGIRVECKDAAGNPYATVARKNSQDSFMTDADPGRGSHQGT